MTPKELKSSILQLAIQGKLVEQRPEEGTAEELYKQIQEEKQRLIKNGKLKKTKSLQQITDKEMPLNFPKSWKVCYIDDIAFVTKLAGFEYTKNIAPNLTTKGIPLFKGKNVQNGKLVFDFESYIPEEISNELPRSQISKRCLLTPYVGTIGNIAIFDGNFKAHLGSNVGKIELLNVNQQYIIEEYVLYYLISTIGYQELTKYKKATAQESISIDAIRNVIIAIPPLAEQKRIVEKLEQILPHIDQYEKAWNKLEKLNKRFPDDMKKSLLQYAIQGKLVEQRPEEGTAEELYKQIQEEKQRLIAEKKIKKEKPLPEITEDEKPFDIPDNWKWVRLGEIFQHNTGKALNSTNKEGINLQYITTSNLYWNRFELDNIKEMFFTKSEVEKFTVKKGDLLVCEGGDVGRAAIWKNDYDIRIQNHIHRLRAYYNVSTEFFYYLFYLYKSAGWIGGKGIGIKGLSSKAIHVIIFPLPPLAEQKRIVEKLEQLLPLCEQLK